MLFFLIAGVEQVLIFSKTRELQKMFARCVRLVFWKKASTDISIGILNLSKKKVPDSFSSQTLLKGFNAAEVRMIVLG